MIIKRTTLVSTLLLTLAVQFVSVQSVRASESRFQRIANNEGLLENIVGKTLTSRNYSITINADYTMEGTYQGNRMRGRWMFVSNEAICFDMVTSMHCVAPSIGVGDIATVRFERPSKVSNRFYFNNPYPNLLGEYSVTH